jgi:hypothetical protein
MKRVHLLVAAVLATSIFSTFASAQTTRSDMTPAATAPVRAESQALQATIVGVKGNVRVRESEEAAWKPAAVGMVLGEAAEFHTGPRSAVQFTIPPDQTITVDSLGLVKLVQAVRDRGKVITNVGMKYGRTRYTIEAAGVEHEAKISSPSSTLAVRGTDFMEEDRRPFPFRAASFTGRVEVQDAKKRVFIGGRGTGRAAVDANSRSAADYAAQQTVVDPGQRLARTDAEAPLISALLSHGATIEFDMEKGIRVVRGGRPLTDRELIPVLPGTLDFVLRWNQDADLNLGVISPRPEGSTANATILPVSGLNIANGGQTAFDHRGGPRGGQEVVFFNTPPDGLYAIGIQNVSGSKAVARVDVFSNGKRVPILRGGVNEPTVTINLDATSLEGLGLSGVGVGLIRVRDGQAVPVFNFRKK